MLMNSEFALTQANRFAKRLMHEGGPDLRAASDAGLRDRLCRPATEAAKSTESLAFLEHQSDETEAPAGRHCPPKESSERPRFHEDATEIRHDAAPPRPTLPCNRSPIFAKPSSAPTNFCTATE